MARMTIRQVRQEFFEARPGKVVGTVEAADLLGIARQRVNRLALDDPTFPRPVTILAGGRIWWRVGIELWAALHRPRRIPAHGRFGRGAAEILDLAEAASAELGHAGVGEDHFWLALVHPDGPSDVRNTLSSVGVDRSEVLAAVVRAYPPGDDETYAAGRRMSPAVQDRLGGAGAKADELGQDSVGSVGIALALLDDWPKRTGDRYERGGGPVTNWLHRRGLDPALLRERLVRASGDARFVSGVERMVLPKRRPARRNRRPAQLRDLAPNPLGHSPWDRHPWGSIFARRMSGRGWIEDGRQYFFFYDRDRYRIQTSDGRPIGYWWESAPPKPGRRPKGSDGAVVVPIPGDDIEWPERLERWSRDSLLAHRPERP